MSSRPPTPWREITLPAKVAIIVILTSLGLMMLCGAAFVVAVTIRAIADMF